MFAGPASLIRVKDHCSSWEGCHQRPRTRVASRQHSTGCPANHKIPLSRYPWGKNQEKMCLEIIHLWSFWVKWLNHLSRTMFLTCPWNTLSLDWWFSLLLLQLSLPTPALLSVISFLFHNGSLDLCNFVYSATSVCVLAHMPFIPKLAFPVKAVQSLNALQAWGWCPNYPLLR